MKNKKGDVPVVWIVVAMLLLLIFAAVYLGAFGKLFGKLFTGANEQARNADDYDKDTVANFVDKCPCNSGDVENDGCPAGYRITETGSGKEDRSCLNT